MHARSRIKLDDAQDLQTDYFISCSAVVRSCLPLIVESESELYRDLPIVD